MSKVAKSKRKSRSKNGKIGKCAEGQDNEYTDSFPNYDSRPLASGGCQCFCIKACIKKRKPRFYHYVWHILARRRLLCSKSIRQRGAPPVPVAFTKEFVSFLGRNFLFFFFFFNQGLSSALDFSISTELPCVNFVKCAM